MISWSNRAARANHEPRITNYGAPTALESLPGIQRNAPALVNPDLVLSVHVFGGLRRWFTCAESTPSCSTTLGHDVVQPGHGCGGPARNSYLEQQQCDFVYRQRLVVRRSSDQRRAERSKGCARRLQFHPHLHRELWQRLSHCKRDGLKRHIAGYGAIARGACSVHEQLLLCRRESGQRPE